MNEDLSCCIVKVEPDGDVHTGRVPGHHLDRRRCCFVKSQLCRKQSTSCEPLIV